MQEFFNILLEFNRQKFDNDVKDAIKLGNKGYVCVVDGNVLTHSTNDLHYRDIINKAIVNSCDGSSIAMIARLIYKQNFTTYTGPEIFNSFVKLNYRQIFLGNTEDVLQKLCARFILEGIETDKMIFYPLPFLALDQFNYSEIGDYINQFQAQIIWVSLGAPKQELFVDKLLPFINKGILINVGAAFNLHIGTNKYKRAPLWIRKIHLEWLHRVIKEPMRIGSRAWNYAKILPGLIIEENKKKYKRYETIS
jgi:N-acetylglucosaminyldiphosphoundecaprenol N-acetyl-beta-D-mannosaminyltransferase